MDPGEHLTRPPNSLIHCHYCLLNPGFHQTAAEHQVYREMKRCWQYCSLVTAYPTQRLTVGPDDRASPQGGTQPPRDRIPHSKPKSLEKQSPREESLFRLGEHSGTAPCGASMGREAESRQTSWRRERQGEEHRELESESWAEETLGPWLSLTLSQFPKLALPACSNTSQTCYCS